MFHKASVKLTSLYLAIIMIISIAFSVSLYQVSIREIDRSLQYQNDVLLQRPRLRAIFDDSSFLSESRQETYNLSKQRLIVNLIFANVAILLCGGLLSYYLARRTLKPIEESHKAQSRFTADASHELRTPIAAMQTETEVALMNPDLNLKQAKSQLQSNLEELAKLTNLSEGLLQLARLESNHIFYEDQNLSNLIQAAIGRVLLRAQKAKVELKFNKSTQAKVKADGALIENALVTLFDNALKYSPPKSEVKVTLDTKQKSAIIKIIDKGSGISKKDLPYVFDRFYRADNARSKNKKDGYGLGLSIAKNIIEKHSGTIKIDSQAGKGTAVIINLPAAS
jgi:two-component system sensor histidine kinase CiaH